MNDWMNEQIINEIRRMNDWMNGQIINETMS